MLDKDLDLLLAAWIRERRTLKHKVSRKMIMDKAKKLHRPIFGTPQEEFKASTGWLERFLVRHKFSSRAPTSRCQKPPAEYAQKLVDFVMYLARIRNNEKLYFNRILIDLTFFRFSYIYASDETPIWLDPTQGKCVDFKGSREVYLCFFIFVRIDGLGYCLINWP